MLLGLKLGSLSFFMVYSNVSYHLTSAYLRSSQHFPGNRGCYLWEEILRYNGGQPYHGLGFLVEVLVLTENLYFLMMLTDVVISLNSLGFLICFSCKLFLLFTHVIPVLLKPMFTHQQSDFYHIYYDVMLAPLTLHTQTVKLFLAWVHRTLQIS